MINIRLKFAVCPAITTLLLTGCMVGPKYNPPSPSATATAPPVAYKESPTQFQETDGWKVAQPQDAMLHGKWWEIYNDPELNALEDKLNIDNQNIKQFFENFMEARTLIAQARSQLYPTVGTSLSYQAARTSSNLTNSPSANTGRVSSVGSLPFQVSWEPDLWGKVRSTIHAQQYNAQLSSADLENEKLSEQASLAAFFFEVRGQDALQKLLNDTVEADKKALDLARARYETGIDDRISVAEAESTLQQVQSQAINLGVARAQFEHAIAVLVGANPSQFSIPVKPLLTNAPAIPLGMPSALLERRPDIAGAERRMAAANAQIGIAYAAYYPSLTLSASYGYESYEFQPFFRSSEPVLVGWTVAERDDLRRRAAACHREPVHYDVQRRRRQLPADGPDGVSTSRRWPVLGAYPVAAGSEAGTGGDVVRGGFEAGDGAVRDRG